MEQLNIQEIANAQIKAIDNAVSNYTFKNEIEKKVESELSTIAKSIDFSAYTGYLTKKLDQIIDKYAKGELAKKIKDEFSKLYLQKRESIKLSEIFDTYKGWLNDELDEEERRDWGSFRIEQSDDGSFIRYKLGKEEKTKYSYRDKILEFSIMTNHKDKKKATLSWIRLDGSSLDKDILRKHLSDFEALLLNIYMNDTTIILDTDSYAYDDTDLDYYCD